jgi:hypothetical protein
VFIPTTCFLIASARNAYQQVWTSAKGSIAAKEKNSLKTKDFNLVALLAATFAGQLASYQATWV